MKISTALDLLMDKGLLSEEDTFTIVRLYLIQISETTRLEVIS